MLMVFVFAFFALAAFALGVLVGPQIHAMIKACQDDHGFSEIKGDLKWDPLIDPGPEKPKRKGKRKGK